MHNPVSEIMTTKLHTVAPSDPLSKVKELFDHHHIHHIPVVRFKELVGMVSKSDFLLITHSPLEGGEADASVFEKHHVEEIMTTRLAKVEPEDQIGTVAEVLLSNMFHAVPVVQEGELVGLVTSFDVIRFALRSSYKVQNTIYD
jgi:acetoin utilization protein AcuB